MIKTKLLLVFGLCLLGFHSLIAQKNIDRYEFDSISVYKALDTLPFTNANLRSETVHNTTKYWVKDKRVNQATYEKYKAIWENIDICRPCYFKTYDENDVLLYEGAQYTDCRVGIWIEYYPNGTVKLIGHYKENDTDNWENLWNRKLCSVKHGKWLYYNEDGGIRLIEYYWNGKLVRVE